MGDSVRETIGTQDPGVREFDGKEEEDLRLRGREVVRGSQGSVPLPSLLLLEGFLSDHEKSVTVPLLSLESDSDPP